MKFPALFRLVTSPSILGVKLTTADSLDGGPLCLPAIWKNWSAPPKNTGPFDVFFSDFEIFEKA